VKTPAWTCLQSGDVPIIEETDLAKIKQASTRVVTTPMSYLLRAKAYEALEECCKKEAAPHVD
jgi:hypothetical protein